MIHTTTAPTSIGDAQPHLQTLMSITLSHPACPRAEVPDAAIGPHGGRRRCEGAQPPAHLADRLHTGAGGVGDSIGGNIGPSERAQRHTAWRPGLCNLRQVSWSYSVDRWFFATGAPEDRGAGELALRRMRQARAGEQWLCIDSMGRCQAAAAVFAYSATCAQCILGYFHPCTCRANVDLRCAWCPHPHPESPHLFCRQPRSWTCRRRRMCWC